MSYFRWSCQGSGQPSSRSERYAYDPLGGLLSKTVSVDGSATSTSVYAYSGAGNANPHAATSVGSASYAYDDDGNLSTRGSDSFAWDYRNRLLSAAVNGATSTYAYDPEGARVRMASGSASTSYASDWYSVSGGKATKHLFANGVLIATVEGSTSTAVVHYVATDHLTGASVVTSATGSVEESLDYNPYGDIRLDNATGYSEVRKFAGHEYDVGTGLSYQGARYYDPTTGRFISQDPIFLLAGSSNFADRWNRNWRNTDPNDATYGNPLASSSENKSALQEYLSNPQGLNSYSYVTNNPLKYIDPTGEWEVHFSPIIPGVNLGLGGEAGNSWTVGFASDGTFGLSTSVHGGGLAGADASINWTAGYSNADTWSDTMGSGQYVSVGGKIGAGGSVTTNFADGKYTGTDVNFGLGVRGLPEVPVAFSGGNNKTTPVFQGSVGPVIDAAKSGYNAVKSTVTNGANAVKQGTSNLLNYVKSKLGN